MKITLEFKLEDLWIGAYWRKDIVYKLYHLWICIIPCFPIHLTWDIKIDNPLMARSLTPTEFETLKKVWNETTYKEQHIGK